MIHFFSSRLQLPISFSCRVQICLMFFVRKMLLLSSKATVLSWLCTLYWKNLIVSGMISGKSVFQYACFIVFWMSFLEKFQRWGQGIRIKQGSSWSWQVDGKIWQSCYWSRPWKRSISSGTHCWNTAVNLILWSS